MRRTRHVVLPVRSWQHVGLMIVSLACMTLGLVSRDREGQAGDLAGPDLQHCAPHKVDACPNENVFTGRTFYDDSASPSSGIILTDQANDHRVTEVRNAPESREIRYSRSSLSRVSRSDIRRISAERMRDARSLERRDDRRSQSLDRRSTIRNNHQERRDEERNRESRRRDSLLSVDRSSRLLDRRTRERDSIASSSSRNDRTISEIGADRRARRIRSSEPLQRRTESRIRTRVTTTGDRVDRENRRRRDTRSLKREMVDKYSRSREPTDNSVERRDDRRSRKVLSERESAIARPRRVISERRDYQSDRRLVRRDTERDTTAINRNERSTDRANRRDRVSRSLDRDSRIGNSRIRIAERRDERRIRDVRYSRQERDLAIRESRVHDARSSVRDSVKREETRTSQLFEKNTERRFYTTENRRQVRESRSLSRRTIDDSKTERDDDRRIKSAEIRNRRSLERDSKSENRYERSEGRTRRSSMIRTSPISTDDEFVRRNSLRNSIRDVRRRLATRQDRIRSGERSSTSQRLNDLERSNSKRRIDVRGVIDHADTVGRIKEEFRSRSRSPSRRSEPVIREAARFMATKNWDERLPSSSSSEYEGLKQTGVLILCLAYGVSLYGGKGSISRNILTYVNRFVVW